MGKSTSNNLPVGHPDQSVSKAEQEKERLIQELSEALRELKRIEEGALHARPAKELLKEL